MKTYTKPEVEITVYETEDVLKLVSGNVQPAFTSENTVKFSDIDF